MLCEMLRTADRTTFDSYRPWFLAAALYNFGWGTLVVAAPGGVLEFAGVPAPPTLALWQVVGMMVLVFAPAYWWASRDPWTHRHLILIGAVSKVLGVGGFLVAATMGHLPWSFGLVTLTNDLIWLPAFVAFVVSVARITGWRALLTGA
jgi:hypothetical protein